MKRNVLAVAWPDAGLWRRPELQRLLEADTCIQWPFTLPRPDLTATLGWGYKRSGRHAAALAARLGIACWRIEDGFLRSVGLGADETPLSVVVDDLGMYYDAGRPSRLEQMVPDPLSVAEAARAQALIALWRQARVSKYNHLPEQGGALPGPYVLVIDQTAGDASIRHGAADASSFSRMLDAALAENPDAAVVVKVHPDVWAGRRKGHFSPAALHGMPRVNLWADNVHPVGLIEHAERIYTVTSQTGFEALLWARPVRCFGMPFYAGWGLTQDDLPAPPRRQPVALAQLAHAALVRYPRYLDPETGRPCEPERLLAWMGLQRRQRQRFAGRVHAVGFSPWKRPIVRSFFQGSEVRFSDGFGPAIDNSSLCAVWGRLDVPQGVQRLVRLEDGFIRSVGLGADLIRPLSWIMDCRGIHYDAAMPSDLEHLLQHEAFGAELLERAARLIERIVGAGLTKYNVGAGHWRRPAGDGRRVVLVPGQVESDASILFGSSVVRRNIDLLRAVRQARPQDWIVYKPHPDVVAGLRSAGEQETDAGRWCDEQVVDCAMGELLGQVDEVHVMTSLAGFEALLRGKPVVTWGQPFYAGWGLTTDQHPPARRGRRLSLAQLVAGALILYPTYVSRATGRYTTPERALDELIDWRDRTPPLPGWPRRALRWLLGWRKR